MATKIIKAWINGAMQEIEVNDILSPEQNPSYEERLGSLEAEDIIVGGRLDKLEDKPIITKGNFLVGNGTQELDEVEPSEVLSRINGANIALVTEEEFGALTNDTVNANTLYLVNDGAEEEYYTKTEIDERVEEINDTHYTKSEVDEIISEIPIPDTYTKEEIDSALDNKTNVGHSHTIDEVNELQVLLDGKSNLEHNHDEVYDMKGSSDIAVETANAYTDNAVSQKSEVQIISTNETENIVETLSTLKIHKLSQSKYEEELANGNIDENALYLTPEDDIDLIIDEHNTSDTAHSDIRELVSNITTKLNNFLNVDEDTISQLSEVLALIESNEGTLESLISGKINVSDIVDNLTTSSTNKVLSAKQGVVIKGLIDALQAEVDGKANLNHKHDNEYEKIGSVDVALEMSQTYTDNAVAQKSQVQIITLEDDDV